MFLLSLLFNWSLLNKVFNYYQKGTSKFKPCDLWRDSKHGVYEHCYKD